MRHDTFKCDECGSVKGETNHWFKARTLSQNGIRMTLLSDFLIDDGYIMASNKWVASSGIFHLCSQQCVIARLSKWMNPDSAIRVSVEK